MLKFNYDNKYDILYILLSDGENSLGDEEYDGLVIMRDETTNQITGLTIFGFIEKYQRDSLPELPSEIDIDFDTIPLLNLKSRV